MKLQMDHLPLEVGSEKKKKKIRQCLALTPSYWTFFPIVKQKCLQGNFFFPIQNYPKISSLLWISHKWHEGVK